MPKSAVPAWRLARFVARGYYARMRRAITTRMISFVPSNNFDEREDRDSITVAPVKLQRFITDLGAVIRRKPLSHRAVERGVGMARV